MSATSPFSFVVLFAIVVVTGIASRASSHSAGEVSLHDVLASFGKLGALRISDCALGSFLLVWLTSLLAILADENFLFCG